MTATLTTRSKRFHTQRDSRRAAIYARVSKDHSGECASVDQQEDAARDLIERRGWTLAGVYVDNSITGTGKKHRPQFYAMLAAVRRGEVDAIVARHMDRIARNPRERLELVEACRNQGVIIALVQGSDMDPTTASGRMIIDVLGSVAEMEVGIKSERHTVALERHAKAGKPPHARALYGYTTKGEVVPAEAEVVRDIFRRFRRGESLRSLARGLDERGVPTRSGRPWNPRSIRDLLSNARFAGRVVYQGEVARDDKGRIIMGNWEPLVSGDVFDVIQATLADPARKSNRVGTDRKYLGTGLFICDTCDGPVSTVNGGKYLCAGHLTREHRHVDRYVREVVAGRLARPDFAQLLAPDEESVKPWTAKAAKLRSRLEQIDNDYAAGDIDAKLHKKSKEKVAAELGEVNKTLAARRGGAALGAVAGAPDPAQAFRDASLMSQRSVIEALCTVRLRRAAKGRLPRGMWIDTSTVDIAWRR